MCQQCVKDGIMTSEQAEAQRRAMDSEDMAGVIGPILEAIAGENQDEAARYETFRKRSLELTTQMGQAHLETVADSGMELGVSREQLAAKFMYEITHQGASALLADLAITLALQANEAADPAGKDGMTSVGIRLPGQYL